MTDILSLVKFRLVKFNLVKLLTYLLMTCITIPYAVTHAETHTEYQVSKTLFGHPDLQGVWSNSTITPLERPYYARSANLSKHDAVNWEKQANAFIAISEAPIDPNAPAPTTADPEKGYESFWVDRGTDLAVIDGQIRTSLISYPSNGKIPYKSKTQSKLNIFLSKINTSFDHPEQRPPGERCIVGYGSSGGPPMLPVLYNNHIQIVQNKENVLIHVEMNHDARIVRLNAEHTALPAWLGDSVGVWQGETLVVTTKHFNAGQDCRASLTHWFCMSENAIVTERFTRIADDEILYEFEVNDPQSFSDVWRGEIPLRAAPGPIYEYACHEGNYGMENILSGARQQEGKYNNAKH